MKCKSGLHLYKNLLMMTIDLLMRTSNSHTRYYTKFDSLGKNVSCGINFSAFDVIMKKVYRMAAYLLCNLIYLSNVGIEGAFSGPGDKTVIPHKVIKALLITLFNYFRNYSRNFVAEQVMLKTARCTTWFVISISWDIFVAQYFYKVEPRSTFRYHCAVTCFFTIALSV